MTNKPHTKSRNVGPEVNLFVLSVLNVLRANRFPGSHEYFDYYRGEMHHSPYQSIRVKPCLDGSNGGSERLQCLLRPDLELGGTLWQTGYSTPGLWFAGVQTRPPPI